MIKPGNTYFIPRTGRIRIDRIFRNQFGETRVTVSGAARFTVGIDELVELIGRYNTIDE